LNKIHFDWAKQAPLFKIYRLSRKNKEETFVKIMMAIYLYIRVSRQAGQDNVHRKQNQGVSSLRDLKNPGRHSRQW
jgi:hypothetical protein